jgi:5'-methylthioadenosine phosphorylase
MSRIGVIAGSGLYEIRGLTIKKSRTVSTPYGRPSEKYVIGEIDDTEIIFLPRHGKHHGIPPHMINYRANIWGFKKLGVKRILSISAVGGIRKGLKPGDIIILDQVLDMTKNRQATFFDGKDGVAHIDFTDPFCPELGKAVQRAGVKSKVTLKKGGTYVAVEGPRLESASEIKSFRILGGDVVGMTGMPEASLAREAEICYAGVSVVANYAAGISRQKLTVAEVMEAMKGTTGNLKKLLKAVFTMIPDERKCACKDALAEAKI